MAVLDDASRHSRDPFQFESEVTRALRPLLGPNPEFLGSADATEEREDTTDPAELVLRGAAWAVRYRFQRHNRKIRLVPRLQVEDSADPPQVRRVDEEVVDSWERLAGRVNGPAARARFFHLLFDRGRGIGRDRAAAAVRGYLGLIGVWRRSSLVEPLSAALDLSRSTSQFELAAEVLTAIETAAREAMDAERYEPGTAFRLLEILVDTKDPPSSTAELLDLAQARYEEARHIDHALLFKLRVAPDLESRRKLFSERVNLWLDEAERVEGAIRAVHLERAVALAEESNDRALWEQATSRLQRIRDDDMQMMRFTSGQRLLFEEVEEMLRPVLDALDLSEALDAFASLGPITGSAERNREQVKEQQRQSPLSSLFPPRLVDGDGLPRFTPTTAEDRFEFHLATTESMYIQLSAGLVAEALERVRDRFGIPSLAELTEHFARNPIVPGPVAAALARAYQRWWAGDGEGAGYTALPRVESLARNLLLVEDVALYRLQRGRSPGVYPGLGQLLDVLATTGLDPDWHRFLRTFLASPSGMNIRNEALHGYHDVQFVNAALVLQAAGYLALLGPRQREELGQ